jgi:hypothetical protein
MKKIKLKFIKQNKSLLIFMLVLVSLFIFGVISYILAPNDVEVALDNSILTNENFEGLLDLNIGTNENEVKKIYKKWDYEKSIMDVNDFDSKGKLYLLSGNLNKNGFPSEISIRVSQGVVYMISEYYTTKDGKELESRKKQLNEQYGECIEGIHKNKETEIVTCDWNSKGVLLRLTVQENKKMNGYQEELSWTKNFK